MHYGKQDMRPDQIPLYNGAIVARRVHRFERAGIVFDVIKPGWNIQGRKRRTWTQFVVDGVPVYAIKMRARLEDAMCIFDEEWELYVKSDDHVREALILTREEHLACFDPVRHVDPIEYIA